MKCYILGFCASKMDSKKGKSGACCPSPSAFGAIDSSPAGKKKSDDDDDFLLARQVAYNGNRKNRNGEGQGPLWRPLTSRIYSGTPFARKNRMASTAATRLA